MGWGGSVGPRDVGAGRWPPSTSLVTLSRDTQVLDGRLGGPEDGTVCAAASSAFHLRHRYECAAFVTGGGEGGGGVSK